MSGIEIIGWIGSLFLGICAIPQAFKSWRQKHSKGLSCLTLALWFLGEILVFIYTVVEITPLPYPLLFNYLLNILLLLIIIYYKWFPKDNNDTYN